MAVHRSQAEGEEHMTQDEIIPLHIEDEYVRNYLWERALIAIDDPCPIGTPKEKEHMLSLIHISEPTRPY